MAIMNNAALTVHIHTVVWLYVSVSPEDGITESEELHVKLFQELLIFPRWLYYFTFPLVM